MSLTTAIFSGIQCYSSMVETDIDRHEYILIGAGGHASVILEILKQRGIFVSCVLADVVKCELPRGCTVRPSSDLEAVISSSDGLSLVNAIGLASLKAGNRFKIFSEIKSGKVSWPKILSKYSIISEHVELDFGVQVFPGAIINPGVSIGAHVILNTGCSVEHDVIIDSFTHVAPRAVVCGGARIGKRCLLGAGSVILPGAIVEDDSVVPAGSVFK
jgi:sugar O-acyltransferase (sialic acid O-acetyltransferase NeuD family)